jgi:hypothetical protein
MLLAVVVATIGLARGPADARTAAADPPSASAAAVQSALGVSAVPAELVFLVDLSDSMSATNHGLYPAVQQALPAYLAELQRQAPQDRVAVITFGRKGSAQVAYGVGPPTPYIGLPPDANLGSTDFGAAFSLALSLFNPAPPGIKFGGVFLLSDGGNDPFGDSQYASYQASGWQALHERAASLPFTVTGYAVPLTTNAGYVDDQQKALAAVFGTHVTALPNGVANLSASLRAAGQAVLDSEVADAASKDSALGVQVEWRGLPGPGSTPLMMRSSGHLDIMVTLRPLTARIPLYVTDLRLTSPGLPLTATWDPQPAVVLNPGRPVTLPVHLSWQPDVNGVGLSGDGPNASGRLMLSGHVQSTYTSALQSAFNDTAFSPGSLQGNESGTLNAITAATDLSALLIIILILLAIAALVAAFLGRLRGTLTLTSVDGYHGDLILWPLPLTRASTNRLVHHAGHISVHRNWRGRGMRIKVQLEGKRPQSGTLLPGQRTMLVGIDILHARRGTFAKREGR